MLPAWWPAVVFGLPVFVLSLVVSATGIALGRAWLPCLGALLAVPSALYLGAQPGMWVAAYALPVLHLLTALAVRYRRSLVASALLVPSLATAILLGDILVRNL